MKILTVGLLACWASPEGGAARLVVRVNIAVRATLLEVVVVRNTGRRARCWGVVGAAAAAGGVAGIRVDKTVGLAANCGSRGVERTL